jgi:hypothetical protein
MTYIEKDVDVKFEFTDSDGNDKAPVSVARRYAG